MQTNKQKVQLFCVHRCHVLVYMNHSTQSVGDSFLLPSGFWELNLGHQAWHQVPMPLGHLANLGPISKL